MNRPKKRWREMSTSQRTKVVLLAVVQIALLVAASTDLARRPAEQVRGQKKVWAGIISINYIGPILYFVRGRKKLV